MSKLLVGWNEWCQLPDLKIPAIKAKIDTGAKTSALHAFDIKKIKGKDIVRFALHPLQRNSDLILFRRAKIIDRRSIMSSNGHKENRYIIETTLQLGEETWLIEVSLSNRDPLQFRLLLGRSALTPRIIIDPSHTLLQRQIKSTKLKKLYRNK